MFYQIQHFSSSEYFCKEYGENFSFPSHLHLCFELITILNGKMTVTIEGDDYLLHPGEAVLVFPHQFHSLQSDKSNHMLCIFSPEIVKAYHANISKKIPENNKFSIGKDCVDRLKALEPDSSLIQKKGALYLLCSEFDNKAKYKIINNEKNDLIYKIFEFVEENCNNDCSLYSLSSQTGYSYSHLSRYFKDIVKISFNAYVNQYRVNNACYMLKNSDSSILECSMECGFTSLRSFNRNFKSITGMTPQMYREKG